MGFFGQESIDRLDLPFILPLVLLSDTCTAGEETEAPTAILDHEVIVKDDGAEFPRGLHP